MADTTDVYKFLKPLVGGSENEWGGNLNDNFDELDDLLSGEKPVNGIDIQSGSIDGSLITGEIGQSDDDLEDDQEPLKIHPDTHIRGKVDRLTGLNPDASDDNDKGAGVIEDCVIKARDLEVKGRIKENNVIKGSATSTTFNPDAGTVQYMFAPSADCEFDVRLTDAGEEVTVILEKTSDTAVNIEWSANGSSQVYWVGGGSPDLEIGINVIQFFSFDGGTGTRVIGAFSGVAS